MRVLLKIVKGPMAGKEFSFKEHDTFLFGRSSTAICCLPDDPYVSRNHFLLEINPPDCQLRDLGSKNGTYVNGKKYGKRTADVPIDVSFRESGDDIQMDAPAETELNDGDVIEVGETKLTLSIEMDVSCVDCGVEIPHQKKDKAAWLAGTYICSKCRQLQLNKLKKPHRLITIDEKPKIDLMSLQTPKIYCAQCGKDVSHKFGAKGRRGDVKYVCNACRKKIKQDPVDIIYKILKKAGLANIGSDAKTPSFPDYEVLRKLGEGAMGEVYLGRHKQKGQLVALKVMIPKVAVGTKAIEWFQREAEIANQLKHPNIVEFYEQGYAGGIFFFSMEYVDGIDVQNLLKSNRGKIPINDACSIICQVLDALEYAHNKNIVHRDLKPPNILLSGKSTNWVAKVSDFGLAKNFAQAGLSGMTMTGQIAGTMPFMPPEQITNYKFVKPASDIYAIGATLYNMITGQMVHDFPRHKDPLLIILQEPIIPVRKRDKRIPKALSNVIEKALERKPYKRYKTAEKMKIALENSL